jgi:hypothetical protein
MVEEYRLELAKKSPIELDLDVSLAWITICWIHETVLISKKFWFIKRLVDNDKIDFREDFYLEDQHWWGFWDDEDIIMLLSIQDNPIDFLCSILK